MTELSEPDLTGGERVVRVFLRLLPREYGNPEGIDDEDVRTARSILAKEYVEHTNISVAWKSGLMLLAYDLLFYLDSQVYGLFLASLGSIALALPNLYTPALLAERGVNEADQEESSLESEAELSVKTNAGVAGLLFGFILQIFSISGPLPDELLSQNSLQGDIPTWLGFVATVTVCGVVLNTLLPKLRARFF